MVQNGDGIMIWISPCQSLWPASLWFTVITTECRRHSHEVWCDMSHLCSSQAEKLQTFPPLILVFLPRCCSPHKTSQIDASSQKSKKKAALYNVNLCFGLICIPIELQAEKLLFLICQLADSGLWGVHISGSDNFRSCAFVSMVTGREGEGFLGVCVCEGAVGRQKAHTDTCTNSQKINTSLLSARIISWCNLRHAVAPVLPYQSESVKNTCALKKNRENRPRPSSEWLWASSELRLLQLSTSLLCGCNFFVQRGEVLTSNRLLCFKTPQLHCSSSRNSSTCPCCPEQQWDKWQDFSISS